MFTAREFPNMPWGEAYDTHCTDQETDDVAPESCTHQQPGCLAAEPGYIVTQDWRGIRAFKKTCQCPAGRSELTPATWPLWATEDLPPGYAQGPEMLLSSRPRKGVARAPYAVPATDAEQKAMPQIPDRPRGGSALEAGATCPLLEACPGQSWPENPPTTEALPTDPGGSAPPVAVTAALSETSTTATGSAGKIISVPRGGRGSGRLGTRTQLHL